MSLHLLYSTTFPPHAFLMGGGGSSQPSPAQQIAAAPVPAAAPPVTAAAAEVVQAQQDLRRQALKKRGFSKTILAGDTGGWMPQTNLTPSPTNPKTPPSAPGARTLGG